MLGKKNPCSTISRRLRREVLVVGDAEALELGVLLAIGAHHPNARQRFLHDRADFRQLRLDLLESLVDGAAEELDRQRHERQRNQAKQRQPGVDRDHQRQGDDEPQQRVRRVHHRRADHHAHGIQIVGGPRHQVAGAVRLEIGERQPLEMREEVVAHVVLDVRATRRSGCGACRKRKKPPTTPRPSSGRAVQHSFARVTPAVRSSMACCSTRARSARCRW